MSQCVTLVGQPDEWDRMTADTPREHRGGRLMRSTDHARSLLRKAQLGLAFLAVPVAVTIGVIAADPAGFTLAAPVAQAALGQYHPGTADIGPTSIEPGSISALARAEDVAELVLAEPDPQNRPISGLTAGLCTLAICWALLGGAAAIWRRRLAGRDLDDWAEGWARVEPSWSDRR